MIRALCEKYTKLHGNEITRVIEISKSLEFMANFYECDVFIDVLTMDKNQAVVVAHSKPKYQSLYEKTVVGEMALRENEPGVLRTLETGSPCNDIRAITQENKLVKQSIHPILEQEKTIGVVIVEKDISEEIKKEFKIDTNERADKDNPDDVISLVRNNIFLANSLDDAVLIFDDKGNAIIRNNKAVALYKQLGYLQDIQGMHYNNLSLDRTAFNDTLSAKEVKISDYWFSIRRVKLHGKGIHSVQIIKDITEIKHKEAEIILKSVAVKEAHHRIKNSLQTVAALLRRQAKISNSEDVKSCLKESIGRIMTIATTHDLLSKVDNGEIHIIKATNSLIDHIKESFLDTRQIQTHITGEEFIMQGEKAMALLLTINEIIQNCYDHAFLGRESGTIQILVQGDENYQTIAIIDNGNGFDVDHVGKDSLGLYIIKSYVTSTLQGHLDIESNEQGTRITLKFLNN